MNQAQRIQRATELMRQAVALLTEKTLGEVLDDSPSSLELFQSQRGQEFHDLAADSECGKLISALVSDMSQFCVSREIDPVAYQHFMRGMVMQAEIILFG